VRYYFHHSIAAGGVMRVIRRRRRFLVALPQSKKFRNWEAKKQKKKLSILLTNCQEKRISFFVLFVVMTFCVSYKNYAQKAKKCFRPKNK